MDDKHQKAQAEVEGWLDAALEQRNTEPRMGLEERILARLAAEPQRKTFTWWPVLVGVAALLLVVAALVLLQTGARDARQVAKAPQVPFVSPSSTQPAVQARNLSSAPASMRKRIRIGNTPNEGTRRSVRAAPRPSTEETLPKLAEFPAARPETQQERLLAQLGKQPEFYEVASSLVGKPVSDLSVPELKISSLESDESRPKK
jgi:hypothetical protein